MQRRASRTYGFRKCLRGTRVEAQPAITAQIGSEGGSPGEKRGLELERGHNHAQKQPRSELLIDQASILGEPSKSRILRGDPLDHRAGINVEARIESLAELRPHRGHERR